jgi:hypothetical protein
MKKSKRTYTDEIILFFSNIEMSTSIFFFFFFNIGENANTRNDRNLLQRYG